MTTVVRASREFEVLAKNPVGEEVWASPAVAEGTILIRGKQHLFRIDAQPGS